MMAETGTVILRFTPQEHELIREAAAQDGRSMNAWCKRALLTAIEDSVPRYNGTKLTRHLVQVVEKPSADVEPVFQKRNSAGKFVKRPR